MNSLPRWTHETLTSPLKKAITDFEIVNVADLVATGRGNFIDGDWIESPYLADKGIRFIQTGNIGVGRFIDKNQKFISEDSFKKLGCTEVVPGDLLICRLADPIGRTCRAPHNLDKMVTSVDVAILRPDPTKADAEFLVHVLNSRDFLAACAELAGGSTRQRISRTKLGKVTLKIPTSVHEQRRIAAVLSALDDQIEKTEALVAKKQLLRRGLLDVLLSGPSSPISAGWAKQPLGSVAMLQRGFDLPNNLRRAGRVPVIGSNGVDGFHAIGLCSGPGVVTGRSGTIGKVHYFKESHWPLNTTLYVRNFFGNHPKFVAYLLEYMDLKRFSAATGVPSLNRNFVHPVEVLVPLAYKEQERIADILTAEDREIEIEEVGLKKLRLQKDGLMHDLLTGNVRVAL